MKKRRQSYRSLLHSSFFILPALVLFLNVSLYQLHLPGLYYDEGFDLTPMLQVLHSEPTELLRGIGLSLFGYTYPVMRMDYMGSLNGYLTMPFMKVFGAGFLPARVQPLVFSLLTLILAFVLARRWFGAGVATVTTLLLSVNPSFIWFTRQGITVTSVMTVFSLAAWVLLDKARVELYAGRGQLRPAGFSLSLNAHHSAVLAGLCLGLGLWAKIIFAWWIALTAVLGLVWLLTSSTAQTRGRGRFGSLLASLSLSLPLFPYLVVGFLIGAAPFIYYNVAGLAQGQPPATFNLLFKALLNPTEYAINNSNFGANLSKRFQDLAVFLNGSYFWYLATVPYGNVFAVPTFLASAGMGSLLAFRRREWRKWLALLACITVYLPISSFTVSDLWATHFFVLLPLPQMIVACAVVWLAQAVVRWLAARTRRQADQAIWVARVFPFLTVVLVSVLLAPTFTRDIWVNQQYHAALSKSGGSGRFSDAVYKLAQHLDASALAEPIALDWGIAAQVRVLTDDRVRPREIFGFTPQATEEFKQQARELLKDPSRQYIVLWEGDKKRTGFGVYNRRKDFAEIAASQGKHVVETFIAHERSGLPVYIILQAK